MPTPDSADSNEKDKKKNFADMVRHVDKLVGRVMSRIEELGLHKRTLFLFSGDNGTSRKIETNTIRGVVKGAKAHTIDAGTYVPLIASWSGIAPGGAEDTPREWVFCHYWKRGREKDKIDEFVRDKRWKLYGDGRLFDVSVDPLEEHPLDTFDGEPGAARERLRKAFDEVRSRTAR